MLQGLKVVRQAHQGVHSYIAISDVYDKNFHITYVYITASHIHDSNIYHNMMS